jgi:hypothetical protein
MMNGRAGGKTGATNEDKPNSVDGEEVDGKGRLKLVNS